MGKRQQSKQTDLFNFINPLKERFDNDFFKNIPKEPGIYIMRDEHGKILYVGKSKNLQQRLRSYRYAKPGNISKKVLKIIFQIRDISWESCESEEQALLRENELLRKHRPEFNQVNTRPETYFFIVLEEKSDSIIFRLIMENTVKTTNSTFIYGSFKGFGKVFRGYGSLLRLLWIASHIDHDLMQIPMKLMPRKPPEKYHFSFTGTCIENQKDRYIYLIKRYLKGTSRKLAEELGDHIHQYLDTENHFIEKLIEIDIDALSDFYETGPYKNYQMFKEFDLNSHVIPQNRLDDLIVRYNHSGNL
ncbi:MAG TPA: GIY-YIG nuclease family protein [Balneolales bacterium]|nr:GIY-YIG nuclease family protein [Balneolales bacterium]